MIYAVIDTNVLVSSFLTRHADSATARVVSAAESGRIIPLYNQEILEEYREVLARPCFDFDPDKIQRVIDRLVEVGVDIEARPWPESMPDEDDRVFFEVAFSAQDADAKLVTGNIKHYPQVNFEVTPAQMIAIIDS